MVFNQHKVLMIKLH